MKNADDVSETLTGGPYRAWRSKVFSGLMRWGLSLIGRFRQIRLGDPVLEAFQVGADGRLFVTRTGKAGVPLTPPYLNPCADEDDLSRLAPGQEEHFLSRATDFSSRPSPI